jgi:SAM-dependent methyltransferase
MEEVAPTPETIMLDVGFSEKEYSPTDNFIEKHYPYPQCLTALGIDTPQDFKQRYPKVTATSYDGTRFPFADKQFDACWSNAVLEHVGGPERQVTFLREVKRVSRTAFITTPNRFFPVEVHTRTPLLHHLPKSLFDRYLALVGKAWASGGYMHLLSESDLRNRLSQAGIEDYRLVRNRFLGFTMDFVVLAKFG